jgi:hypothetical protein
MGSWPTVEKGECGAMLGFKEGSWEATFLLSMHWDHGPEDFRFEIPEEEKE